MGLSLRSLGGAGTVTGSRHLVEAGDLRLLIDCGLFQGLKVLRERNWAPFPVDPASIDAVVLTHAHLDHSGYLPRLVAEGFRGPVYCTAATADLADILLRDSARIGENDAEHAARKGYSRHAAPQPLYTVRDVECALKRLRPLAFGGEFDIPGGAVRFRRAGHILGAATVELTIGDRRLAFSGDLGRYDDVFMHAPEPTPAADYVIVESTYGDRLHPKDDPVEALGAVVERTVRRGGTVVIPAFAVGRAQVLLHHLWTLKQAGRLANVPVFLDSPMAINATRLLQEHFDDHRLPRDVCEAACNVAIYTSDVDASKAISRNPMPKVVIAGSGMATGGRVLHHIKTFGTETRHTILFAGFQAPGTRGARLLAGEREIKMLGRWIEIRAEVANLPELSAHADAEEIVRWLSGFGQPPRKTFIVHGEPESSDALRVRIGRALGWEAAVVDPLRRYDLV